MVRQPLVKLQQLWKLWVSVALHIRRIHPTASEVDACSIDAASFVAFFQEHFATQKSTTYLHFVTSHLAQFTRIFFNEFGFGYGLLSTQGTEHMNLQLKEGYDATWKGTPYCQLITHAYQHVELLVSAKPHIEAKQIHHCSLCGKTGHNSRTCNTKEQQIPSSSSPGGVTPTATEERRSRQLSPVSNKKRCIRRGQD